MTSYSVTSPGGITSSIRMEPLLKMATSVPGAARSMLAATSSVSRVGKLRTLASRPSSASVVVAITRFGVEALATEPGEPRFLPAIDGNRNVRVLRQFGGDPPEVGVDRQLLRGGVVCQLMDVDRPCVGVGLEHGREVSAPPHLRVLMLVAPEDQVDLGHALDHLDVALHAQVGDGDEDIDVVRDCGALSSAAHHAIDCLRAAPYTSGSDREGPESSGSNKEK